MAAATRIPLPSVTMHLPHATSSVRAARRKLCSDLYRRGLGDETISDAALVLSEMMSNALRHARPLDSGQIRVAWDVSSTSVGLQVSDGGGPTRPYLQTPSLTSVGGRGLAIVATLCTEWGVRQEADATIVWAMLAAPAPAAHSSVAPVARSPWTPESPIPVAAPDRLPPAGRPSE